MKVAILFGSKSDMPTMKKAADVFKDFGVSYTAYAVSAHRSPELLAHIIQAIETDGTELVIAAAGLAAHLPGVVASKTLLPVIGVPINSGGLGGLDALLSIVQMPKPVPVATVGIDKAANAAMLACRILAIKYPDLQKSLANYKKHMKEDLAKDKGIVEL
jgi:5-(carboxyamino)imidazole ribonucleotide mutase